MKRQTVKEVFCKYINIISINVSLLIFMILMLWIKPVDGLRKYNIYSHPGEADEVMLPVYSDSTATQYFRCSEQTDSFEIFVSSENEEYHGSFNVSLFNEAGDIIEEWNTDKLDIAEGWVQYRLKDGVIEPGQDYRIVVTAPDLDEFGAVEVSAYMPVDNTDGTGDLLYEGPAELDHSGMKMSYGIYRNMTNIFAVMAFLCLFVSVNIGYALRDKGVEKFALPVLIGSGLIMMFILAPGSGPDDTYHYYSSVGLSNKLLLHDNIFEIEKKYESDLPMHYNTNAAFVEAFEGLRYRVGGEEGTYIYEGRMDKLKWPLSHLAQAIGITAGRLLKLGFIRVYTLGRIFNLAAYIALALLAIKLVPVNKELMLMMAILPMSMQQATQLSYDVSVNGLALVFVGYVFKLLYEKKPFSWKNTLICTLLLIAISPLKVVYILLGLILLLIPGSGFRSVTDRIFKLGITMGGALVSLILTRGRDVTTSVVSNSVNATDSIAVPEVQNYTISFFLENPVRSVRFIIANSESHFSDMVKGMIGGSLSGFTLNIPEYLVMFFALCLIICAVSEKEAVIEKEWQIVILILMVLIGYFAVLAIFALAETTYGIPYIGGIQGRYLIPFMIPAMYCLCGRKVSLNINRSILFIPIAFIEIGYIVEVMNCINF